MTIFMKIQFLQFFASIPSIVLHEVFEKCLLIYKQILKEHLIFYKAYSSF